VHTDPQYCLAVTKLHASDSLTGTGFAPTLGAGNRLVCEAIEMLATSLVGRDLEELMANFWSGDANNRRRSHFALAGAAQGRGVSGARVHCERLLRSLGQEPRCSAEEAAAGPERGRGGAATRSQLPG
jgi:hypothetical protein